jgi:hypothetical protein
MTTPANDQGQDRRQQNRVNGLQRAVYSQPDPSARPDLLRQLAEAQAKLQELEQQATAKAASAAPETPQPATHGRFLGPETTGLSVTSSVTMQPLPTGIYHLLDPETDPLVTVTVENVAHENKTRRVCVKAHLEGLSAEAVRTVELKRKEAATLKLLPTLLLERARALTEVQRATLHVLVTDLDGKPECHDTHAVVCLARTSSFNSVRRPGTDEPVDLTDYYGAWVTPYAEPVQQLLRRAIDHCGGFLAGYQGDAEAVERQVAALYQALREAGIAYVNSVIDFGAAPGMATQRTRLPREALAGKSANCIDGAVLFASLLEAASLNAALVFVPGHAFVGWQTGDLDDAPWRYLETTMIGGHDFADACRSGQRQFDEARKYYPKKVKECQLPRLRARGIWPME